MAYTPLDTEVSVDLTGMTADAWNDVDIDDAAYSEIPGAATGLKIRIHNDGSDRDFAARCKEHTTDYIDFKLMQSDALMEVDVGLDGNNVFQVYVEELTGVSFDIIGYYGSEAQWHGVDYATSATEPDDVTPGTKGSWQDVDISTETGSDTAVAAMVHLIDETSSPRETGVRPNGTTVDARKDLDGHVGAIVPCDGSEIFEAYVEDSGTTVKLCLVGYMTEGFTSGAMTDAKPTFTNAWTDYTSVGGADATAVVLWIASATKNRDHGLRPNGETGAFWSNQGECNPQVACLSATAVSGVVEAWIRTDIAGYAGFHEIGYYTAAAAGTTVDVDHLSEVTWRAEVAGDETSPGDSLTSLLGSHESHRESLGMLDREAEARVASTASLVGLDQLPFGSLGSSATTLAFLLGAEAETEGLKTACRFLGRGDCGFRRFRLAGLLAGGSGHGGRYNGDIRT